MHLAGTVIKITDGFTTKYGIADGEGNVIHNSKEKMKVVIDALSDFSDGNKIEECSAIKSYDMALSVAKARKYLGLPYSNLFCDNEQFVRFVHGIEPENTQIHMYISYIITLGIIQRNKEQKYVMSAVDLFNIIFPSQENSTNDQMVARLFGAGWALIEENNKKK